VEAVRAAHIFASGKDGDRQYQKWQRRSRKASPALDGAELEAKVMGLAFTHPEYVVVA
jgi:hypothetical protein